MDEVDIEFNSWANREQPIAHILAYTKFLSTQQGQAIFGELKRAFAAGYARGVAAEAAKYPPT